MGRQTCFLPLALSNLVTPLQSTRGQEKSEVVEEGCYQQCKETAVAYGGHCYWVCVVCDVKFTFQIQRFGEGF